MRHWMKALGLAVGLAGAALPAAEVVAVLSSNSAPYKEALEGLKSVVGEVNATTLPVMPKLDGAKVVVTFGGEAALKKYPATLAMVAALLPDPKLKPGHGGALTRVGIPPAPGVLVARIKEVEAGTLAVLDSGSYADYVAALKSVGETGGLSIQVKKVADLADLASKLPGLKGTVKSLWFPPDPLFMNPKTFGLLAAFCKGSGISLIAPLPGLVKAGASAGIAPSFKQQGAAAGAAVLAFQGGGSLGPWVYSDKVEFAKGN